MRAIRVAAALCLLAGAVFAGFGSVISSFRVAEPGGQFRRARGLYRDGSYVYCIAEHNHDDYLCRYTPTGSLIRSTVIRYPFYYLRDGESCHLGSGYFAVGDTLNWAVYFINKNSGAVVSTLHLWGPGSECPSIVVWNGSRYYISTIGSMGEFCVYTTAGSLVRNWAASGWPAAMDSTGGATYADCALGKEGHYLVASTGWPPPTSCIIDMDNGSLVRMWSDAPLRITSADYGRSSQPAVYGDAYWVVHSNLDVYTIREIDLAAAHPAVVPASVGRIKAIYR